MRHPSNSSRSTAESIATSTASAWPWLPWYFFSASACSLGSISSLYIKAPFSVNLYSNLPAFLPPTFLKIFFRTSCFLTLGSIDWVSIICLSTTPASPTLIIDWTSIVSWPSIGVSALSSMRRSILVSGLSILSWGSFVNSFVFSLVIKRAAALGDLTASSKGSIAGSIIASRNTSPAFTFPVLQ